MTSTIDAFASRGDTARPTVSNALLGAFDDVLLEELKPHFQRVSFAHGDILGEPSDITHMIFVEAGVVGAIWSDDQVRFQTHLIGSEGCLNAASWIKPTPSNYTYRALIGGSAIRISAQTFRELTKEVAGVCRTMAVYAASLQREIAKNAAYATRSATTQMARLIMSLQDRTGQDQFTLTQSEVAEALGVQRTTINQAAQHLFQSKGMTYTRAKVKIVDRGALERCAFVSSRR
jgi:CRP-like cAMP-binding protein